MFQKIINRRMCLLVATIIAVVISGVAFATDTPQEIWNAAYYDGNITKDVIIKMFEPLKAIIEAKDFSDEAKAKADEYSEFIWSHKSLKGCFKNDADKLLIALSDLYCTELKLREGEGLSAKSYYGLGNSNQEYLENAKSELNDLGYPDLATRAGNDISAAKREGNANYVWESGSTTTTTTTTTTSTTTPATVVTATEKHDYNYFNQAIKDAAGDKDKLVQIQGDIWAENTKGSLTADEARVLADDAQNKIDIIEPPEDPEADATAAKAAKDKADKDAATAKAAKDKADKDAATAKAAKDKADKDAAAAKAAKDAEQEKFSNYLDAINSATTLSELETILGKVDKESFDDEKLLKALHSKIYEREGNIYKDQGKYSLAKSKYEKAKSEGKDAVSDFSEIDRMIDECNDKLSVENTDTQKSDWEKASTSIGTNPSLTKLNDIITEWVLSADRAVAEERLSELRGILRTTTMDSALRNELVARCWEIEAHVAGEAKDYNTAGGKYRIAEKGYRAAGNKKMGNLMETYGDEAYAAANKTDSSETSDNSATSPTESNDDSTDIPASNGDSSDTSDEDISSVGGISTIDNTDTTDNSDADSATTGVSSSGDSNISISIPGMGVININGTGNVSVSISVGGGSIKINVANGNGDSTETSVSQSPSTENTNPYNDDPPIPETPPDPPTTIPEPVVIDANGAHGGNSNTQIISNSIMNKFNCGGSIKGVTVCPDSNSNSNDDSNEGTPTDAWNMLGGN